MEIVTAEELNEQIFSTKKNKWTLARVDQVTKETPKAFLFEKAYWIPKSLSKKVTYINPDGLEIPAIKYPKWIADKYYNPR